MSKRIQTWKTGMVRTKLKRERALSDCDDADSAAAEPRTKKTRVPTSPSATQSKAEYTETAQSTVMNDQDSKQVAYVDLHIEGPYQLVLKIDNRERSTDLDAIEQMMTEENVTVDYTSLACNDYVLVARLPDNTEYVCATIEFKTAQDLNSSIKGPRYLDQKARNGRFELANKYYVVAITPEYYRMANEDIERVNTAAVASSGVLLGNQKLFPLYLKGIVRHTRRRIETCPSDSTAPSLRTVTFETYQEVFRKKDIDSPHRMLMAALININGITQRAALPIASHFGSLNNLLHLMNQQPRETRAKWLMQQVPGSVGEVLSKRIVSLLYS
jgi:ERCC4-type nuclease